MRNLEDIKIKIESWYDYYVVLDKEIKELEEKNIKLNEDYNKSNFMYT